MHQLYFTLFALLLFPARDFGSLIPEIKGYSRDIVPGITINPKERVAIMRKGGTIQLSGKSTDAIYFI